jgi:hypothetical protein
MLIQSFPRGGGGGSTGVTSFNGRTGDVTPQNGDYTKGQVGLGNVDNTADADKPVSTAMQTALNGKVDSSEKGTASGIATLGADGKVPTNQLPGAVFFADYGTTTFADVLAAFKAQQILYCRASSQSDPSVGNKLRLGYLAYLNDQNSPSEFEFQYYRSVSTHTDGAQGDEIYIYKISNTNGWSFLKRYTYTRMAADGTTINSNYNGGKMTFSLNTDSAPTENSTKAVTSGGIYTALSGKVNSTEKGAANGIATLDANGKVPSSQIPGGGGGGRSEVTPNPAGAATADLEKVDIDGTIFNVLTNAVHKTGDESIAGTKTFTGNVVCNNPIMVQGADYAEKFKTLENIPLYRFVTLDGEYAKLAQRNDYVLGVTSNTPGILGNILVDEGIAVGLVGQLWVEQDGTAEVNDFVTSGDLGIATKAAAGYRVMAVNGNKCKILFR